MQDDLIDLNDAADTLRAYEEQRAKRERSGSQDQRATRQAQAAAGAPHAEVPRRPPFLVQGLDEEDMGKSEAKPLKAYIAHDGDEGWSVQYATNGAAARRDAAGEFGCDFSEVESCKRAPSLDEYAPGPAPAHALIDMGWRFECGCCGRWVSSDLLEDVYDEGLDPGDFEITTRGTWAFCSRTCMGMFDEEQRAAKRAMAAAIEAAAIRFPFADKIFAHKQGFADARELSVWFPFPGGEAPAHWRVGESTVSIIQRDEPAWRAVADSLRAREST